MLGIQILVYHYENKIMEKNNDNRNPQNFVIIANICMVTFIHNLHERLSDMFSLYFFFI